MRIVFMSYRRADSADVSGRIRDHLVSEFGDDAIFKDVISIPPGQDFCEYIKAEITQCDVFLPVIGNSWLNITNEHGERRLDDPDDLVRQEIESAIELKVPIIPLLVTGATMPRREDLPESLARIAALNAHTVRADPDFQADMLSLSRGIKHHLDWVVRHRLGNILRLRRIMKAVSAVLPSRMVLRRAAYMLLACLFVGAAGGWVLDKINDYDGDYLLLGGIFGLLFYLYYSLFARWARYGKDGFTLHHKSDSKS